MHVLLDRPALALHLARDGAHLTLLFSDAVAQLVRDGTGGYASHNALPLLMPAAMKCLAVDKLRDRCITGPDSGGIGVLLVAPAWLSWCSGVAGGGSVCAGGAWRRSALRGCERCSIRQRM